MTPCAQALWWRGKETSSTSPSHPVSPAAQGPSGAYATFGCTGYRGLGSYRFSKGTKPSLQCSNPGLQSSNSIVVTLFVSDRARWIYLHQVACEKELDNALIPVSLLKHLWCLGNSMAPGNAAAILILVNLWGIKALRSKHYSNRDGERWCPSALQQWAVSQHAGLSGRHPTKPSPELDPENLCVCVCVSLRVFVFIHC